ncbi:MAG TPA: 1-acyl-sn-glycerol-3-phosphate acyltransferase [Bacteroidales bacterium]|nr:1-acyl-sn-glycerol-3-phosphate acyltransferase [Bacteroidales bacterium]
METIEKIINIEKTVRNSQSPFIRSLPKFIINLIARIVKQDEINAVIHSNHNKEGVPFINGVLDNWNVKVEVKGDGNIPETGRFIFVANHPVGGMDAMSLFSVVYSHFPDVIFPSNDLFRYIPQLKKVLLGINVFGKNSRETAEKLNSLFGSSAQVLYFPAGEVSRRNKRIISDIAWQKSFVTKAIQHQRDIIPIHISGRNSDMFYIIARLRKMLGIKLYIETMLLPREMVKQINSTFTLTIGEPVSWKSLTGSRTHYEWAQQIKQIVYSLPAENK